MANWRRGLLNAIGDVSGELVPFTRYGSDYFSPDSRRAYGGVNSIIPPSEWEVRGYSVPTDKVAADLIRPEDIPLNTRIFWGGGDRTSLGDMITEVNGVRLGHPVTTEGGATFMDRLNRLWASEAMAMARKNNAMQQAMRNGEDVMFGYTPMSETSGDFSQHQFDLLKQYILGQRGMGHNGGPSLDDQDALALAFGDHKNITPELGGANLRVTGAKTADSAASLNAGGPEIAAIRFAGTDPNLVNTPSMSIGYRFGRPVYGAPVEISETVHGTYNGNIPKDGNSMTFGGDVPWWFGMRDVAEPYLAKFPTQTPQAYMQRSVMMNPNNTQLVDQQWVDEVSRYLELLNGGGKGAADVYAQGIFDRMIGK